MARFYRTASANPMDYMYRANIPLMEKVIGANDLAITQQLDQSDKLGNAAAAFPYLQQDSEDAAAITKQYSDQVDQISDAIRSDPANWRNQTDSIKGLQRGLQTDYKTGKISKIMENYNKYKTTADYIDEQTKQYSKDGKGISADRANAYKQNFLSNFKGTIDKTTGQYNSINVFNPMNNIDVRKRLSEELDKMKADGDIRVTDQITGNGEYFNKETKKWEGITPEKILRIVTARLNDPQLMDYLKQDTQVGLIKGVYNDDPNSPEYGHFINPYSYDKQELSSAEQKIITNTKAQIDKTKDKTTKEHLQEQLDSYTKGLESRRNIKWNDQSYLGPIMRGITDEHSFSKTDTENDLSANPIWQSRFTQQNENARASLAQTGQNDRQVKLLDQQAALQKEKIQATYDLELLKQAGALERAGLKGTAKDKDKDGATKNEVIGTSYVTPFYHMTEQKDKLTTALSSEIETTKNNVESLNKALADITKADPNNKVMIANAENEIANSKAKLNTLEGRRQVAVDYAINEWKAKKNQEPGFVGKMFGSTNTAYNQTNEKLLKEYLSGAAKKNIDSLKDEMSKVEAKANSWSNPNALGSTPSTDPAYAQYMKNVYYPTKRRFNEIQDKFDVGREIYESQIKDTSNNKLAKAAETTTNSADIVSTTKVQNETVRSLLSTTPSSYKIMNKNGEEINLTFEHGSANPADLKILGVSPSTGLEGKGIQVLGTLKGSPIIITPKNDGNKLSDYLTKDFITSKDENVRNIGRILSSPIAAVLSDAMTEIKMNTEGGFNTKDTWVYRTIQNPSNPRDVVKIRIREIDTNGKPKWEVQSETDNERLLFGQAGGSTIDVSRYIGEDGKAKGYAPLPSTEAKNGIYNSLEDILKRFPSK